MRKHLQNATIDSISLIPFDRIVKIDFVQKGEFFSDAVKTVYVELMGRYSNVILTENGKVLGGNRGVNFFDNGVRPLIVGRDYTLPPKGEKKEPWDTSLIDIFNANKNLGTRDLIVSFVQGIAYSTALEIESEIIWEKILRRDLRLVLILKQRMLKNRLRQLLEI
jgi:predicted ribosome quality control (RQC) complex YloA/Tae2 family protein